MPAIIPRSISGFNRYINQTNAHLIEGSPENYTLYNWTSDDLTAWQNFLVAWNLLYNKYRDKKGGYTTNIKNQLLVIIAQAVLYADENRLILLVKATKNLSTEACSVFNIPQTYANATADTHHADAGNKTKSTTEGVYAQLLPLLGGFVRCKGFPEVSSSGRAHKLHGYDLLEYAAGVFYSDDANLPTHADDPRLKIAHSSRASFILQTAAMINNLPPLAAGAKAPAKVLVIFFRWAKSKHPDLDGPWSVAYTTVLL